jgi:CPA1 family monovalent cation:H+ antiporter
LVFQGLTLPWLIRKVDIKDRFTSIPEQKQELIIQKKIVHASLQFLEEKYGKERVQNEYLNNLFAKLQIDLNFFQRDFEELDNTPEKALSGYQRIYLELLEQQRKLLDEMNRHADFDEDLIRKYLSLIDLEELKLREKLL